ncbi:MAG: hypothetical protein H0W72_00705 [Planctomycetes bacterium]|nr:hypothetical protein [Planctomycetota bacterium]
MSTILDRARAYLCAMPAAISGQGGHDAAFRAACILVHGFALPESSALSLMHEYNHRCQPPWSGKELEHKVADAQRTPDQRPIGYMLVTAPMAPGGHGTVLRRVKIGERVEQHVEQPTAAPASVSAPEPMPEWAAADPVIVGLMAQGRPAETGRERLLFFKDLRFTALTQCR